jgi:hypothetical protein
VLNKLLCDQKQQQEQDGQLTQMIRRMEGSQLSTLLDYACQWNTNTRNYAVCKLGRQFIVVHIVVYCTFAFLETGQLVLNCALSSVPPKQLLKLPNIESIVKGFLPYSIR